MQFRFPTVDAMCERVVLKTVALFAPFFGGSRLQALI